MTYAKPHKEGKEGEETSISAQLLFKANELSITSRVYQHLPATWLTLTLDPHQNFIKYRLAPDEVSLTAMTDENQAAIQAATRDEVIKDTNSVPIEQSAVCLAS